MGLERPKRSLLWKNAASHFTICFLIGFFTSFAPLRNFYSQSNPATVSIGHLQAPLMDRPSQLNVERVAEEPSMLITLTRDDERDDNDSTIDGLGDEQFIPPPRKLLVVVTPMSGKEKSGEAVMLRRLAQTLKLVPPPLLWIVVERDDGDEASRLLRNTGIMYRHLVMNRSFTNSEEELNYQRNLALRHIELHRISGIVHFAEPGNVYDLRFFDYLREILDFGAWPYALVSPKTRRVMINGPICESSLVIGWHTNRTRSEAYTASDSLFDFAFNSSILWDPERWGRSSLEQRTDQDSLKFVKQVALDDDTKILGIPHDQRNCSEIMLWISRKHKSNKEEDDEFESQ